MSLEIVHSLHSCGHAVYYLDALWAIKVAPFPCPWCGGGSGKHYVPRDVNVVADLDGEIFGFKYLNPDGTVPIAKGEAVGDEAIIRHMTGDVCCKATRWQ